MVEVWVAVTVQAAVAEQRVAKMVTLEGTAEAAALAAASDGRCAV